jgi:hypothetical protein
MTLDDIQRAWRTNNEVNLPPRTPSSKHKNAPPAT